MAVLWVREVETDAELGESASKRRVFRVRTSTGAASEEAAVLSATGIPRFGDVYSIGLAWGTGLRCMSVTARRDMAAPDLWEVVARYERPRGTGGGDYRPDSILVPLERPTHMAWSYEEIEDNDGTDVAGNALTNTIGQPLLSPPTKYRSIMLLTMQRNEPTFREALISSLIGKRNQGAWCGFPSGAVLFRGARATGPMYDNDQWYYDISYEFAVDRVRLWNAHVANQGTKYKNAAGQIIAVTDANGVETGETINLAADGSRLPAGAAPHLLTFEMREAVSFAPLNLP